MKIKKIAKGEKVSINQYYKYQNHTISNSGYAVSVSMDPVLELISAP